MIISISYLFKIKKLYYYDENVFSVYSVYKDLDTKVSRYLNNNIGKINAIKQEKSVQKKW